MSSLRISVALPAFVILSVAGSASAEVLTDAKFGFTLRVPDGFERDATVAGAKPDFLYAFRRQGRGDFDDVVIVERMHGVLGREKLNPKSIRPDLAGRLIVLRWRGFDLDAFEIPEKVGEIEAVNFNVQIPLKREAIQLRVLGAMERRAETLQLTNELLASLEGESNWLDSLVAPAFENSPYYTYILGGAALFTLAAGLAALWFVGRRGPAGTSLAVAVGVYALSWGFQNVRAREIVLAQGTLRLLGFLGVLLGLFQMWRRKSEEKRARGETANV